MNNYHEKLRKNAAAWILKGLSTNDLWFDENNAKKKEDKNYLFIPLFDIAFASKNYDFNTLKEACYLLSENGHVNIWGDDYDPRAMLVQISENGVEAYRDCYYGRYYQPFIKKAVTAIAAIGILFILVSGLNKFISESRQHRNLPRVQGSTAMVK